MSGHTVTGAGAHRRIVGGAILGGLSVMIASAAWACAPMSNRQTFIQSCQAPVGATRVCKTPVGQPPFPNATFVKGPRGSLIMAYVNSGLFIGIPFDLIFVGKPELAAGETCVRGTRVIGGPTTVGTDGGLAPTAGTIPTDAPLGGGQVCFVSSDGRTDAGDATGNSSSGIAFPGEPAVFKVVI